MFVPISECEVIGAVHSQHLDQHMRKNGDWMKLLETYNFNRHLTLCTWLGRVGVARVAILLLW